LILLFILAKGPVTHSGITLFIHKSDIFERTACFIKFT